MVQLQLTRSLLFEVSASELLASDVYGAVLTVPEKYGATTRSDHDGRGFALVDHDLALKDWLPRLCSRKRWHCSFPSSEWRTNILLLSQEP